MTPQEGADYWPVLFGGKETFFSSRNTMKKKMCEINKGKRKDKNT
jgi:hypothetical protein